MADWPDTVHFIADIHLSGDDTPAAQRLAGYLAGPAREASALYILGDLFDVWIGDDVSFADHQATLDALAGLQAARMPLYFLRGNRDFGVGRRFLAHTGARILADPVVHRVGGRPTLLAHGDVFCSQDTAHQRFRRRYTNPRWRARMLRIPAALRRAAARRARARSQAAKQHKSDALMDVTDATVRTMAEETGAMRVIHGHTHRPADHRDGGLTRHVLCDWRADYAEVFTVSRRGLWRCPIDDQGRFTDRIPVIV